MCHKEYTFDFLFSHLNMRPPSVTYRAREAFADPHVRNFMIFTYTVMSIVV